MPLKQKKQRTYLDPIHGPIKLFLDDPIDDLLSRLIDTKEFQRLRRIRQLGTGWLVFHGAEHSRFGHSIGTLFIALKIINHLSRQQFEINKYETQILVSSLLHDIGHGPFSHTSEKLSNVAHEEWTKSIVVGNTEINSVLSSFDKKLPGIIKKAFEYKDVPLYVSQLISSYIDCDRLDYLHRDSYYVGVPYGLTGSDRIIASLEIDSKTKKLVVNESIGLDAVIHYLHARYSMYKQIYQHKKNLANDFLLLMLTKRMKETKSKNIPAQIIKWLSSSKNNLDLDSFLYVDDYLFISTIEKLAYETSEDQILRDLCYSFVTRNLFKSLEFKSEIKKERKKEIFEKIKKIAISKNLSPDFYLGIQESSSKPYEPYKPGSGKTGKAVFIKEKSGEVKELSKVSGLVSALSKESIVKTCLIFSPKIEDEISNIKGFSEFFK